jgi:hypothetical protein
MGCGARAALYWDSSDWGQDECLPERVRGLEATLASFFVCTTLIIDDSPLSRDHGSYPYTLWIHNIHPVDSVRPLYHGIMVS